MSSPRNVCRSLIGNPVEIPSLDLSHAKGTQRSIHSARSTHTTGTYWQSHS